MDNFWSKLCGLIAIVLLVCAFALIPEYESYDTRLKELKSEENTSPKIVNTKRNSKETMNPKQRALLMKELENGRRTYLIVVISFFVVGTVFIFAAFCSYEFCVRERRAIRRPAPIFHIYPQRIQRRRPRVSESDREAIRRANIIPFAPEPAFYRRAPNEENVIAADLPGVSS